MDVPSQPSIIGGCHTIGKYPEPTGAIPFQIQPQKSGTNPRSRAQGVTRRLPLDLGPLEYDLEPTSSREVEAMTQAQQEEKPKKVGISPLQAIPQQGSEHQVADD